MLIPSVLSWISSFPRATLDSLAPQLLFHQETSTPVNQPVCQELPVVHVSSTRLPRFAPNPMSVCMSEFLMSVWTMSVELKSCRCKFITVAAKKMKAQVGDPGDAATQHGITATEEKKTKLMLIHQPWCKLQMRDLPVLHCSEKPPSRDPVATALPEHSRHTLHSAYRACTS